MSRRAASPFITLDRSRREACWECIGVCPQSVIGKVEFWRHRHSVIETGNACIGCGRCVRACASGALSELKIECPVLKEEGQPDGPC